jgi:hypothetical protein
MNRAHIGLPVVCQFAPMCRSVIALGWRPACSRDNVGGFGGVSGPAFALLVEARGRYSNRVVELVRLLRTLT